MHHGVENIRQIRCKRGIILERVGLPTPQGTTPTILHHGALGYTILHHGALGYTILHHGALGYTILHHGALGYTILHHESVLDFIKFNLKVHHSLSMCTMYHRLM